MQLIRLACCLSLAACIAGEDGDPTSGEENRGDRPGDEEGPEPAESCFEAWADPVVAVVVGERPDPAEFPALRFWVDYSVSADYIAQVTLEAIDGLQPVLDSQGPFSPETHSGSWAELRDADDQVLYTRGASQLIPEIVEAPGDPGTGSFSNAFSCPDDGTLLLQNFPNDPRAASLVLFQEPIDGAATASASELVRFALP